MILEYMIFMILITYFAFGIFIAEAIIDWAE